MRLRFEFTLDDYAAWQSYYLATIRSARRSLTADEWVSFAIAGGVIVIALADHEIAQRAMLWLALVMSANWLVINPVAQRYARKKDLRRVQEEPYKKIFGEQSLELAPDGLVHRTALAEHKAFWTAIERVGATDHHTFIHLTPDAAFVIPHNRLREGDFSAFMSELQRRLEAKQQAQPSA